LLKRDAQFLADLGLAHFESEPALAHAGTDTSSTALEALGTLFFALLFSSGR
jgi:hypothetical protein